jgi:hypothetical protein
MDSADTKVSVGSMEAILRAVEGCPDRDPFFAFDAQSPHGRNGFAVIVRDGWAEPAEPENGVHSLRISDSVENRYCRGHRHGARDLPWRSFAGPHLGSRRNPGG